MNYQIEKSFSKSVKEMPKDIQFAVLDFIKIVESADQISDIANIKKLKTNKKDMRDCYQYKSGNYRLGFLLEENKTVILIIIDHRKNIYRSFP